MAEGVNRPAALDARASFNNSVNLRISSKRLIQTFTTHLGSKLYLTDEELSPSRPLIESFVKEVCALTYDIVKDDRQRLGDLQERYNTLVEANRRSQLGYMRELVALRDKVRRTKDDQHTNLSTSDYDVMFYDALQFLDADAKELIATVTNERVRLILHTKKTSSDIHGTKHVVIQTDVPYPSFAVDHELFRDLPPPMARGESLGTPPSRGLSEIFHDDDISNLHDNNNNSHNIQIHNHTSTQIHTKHNTSETSSESEDETEARKPRIVSKETTEILQGAKSKKKQIARLIALIEEKSANMDTQRQTQTELNKEISEFREKLKELDVVKRKLQIETKRRGKLEIEFGVLKKIVDNEKLAGNHPELLARDTQAEDEGGEGESLENYEEEVQVFLRLYKDASSRVQRFKLKEKEQQQIESEAIIRKQESLLNDDPAMNLVDMNATFVADDQKFLVTKRIRAKKLIWSVDTLDHDEFADLAIGTVNRQLIVDDKSLKRSPLPVIKTKKEKQPHQLAFLCRDHGGILPPTLACDKCRKLLQPPMGIGTWN